MWRRFGLSIFVLIASGCTKRNPEYCATNDDCSSGEVCDLSKHDCVAAGGTDAGFSCSTNDQCQAATPVCGSDGACRVCELDDECASGVCTSDGSCELPERILYVAPNAPAAGQCEQATPCELYYARTFATEERRTLRLAQGAYTLAADFIVDGAIANLIIVGGRNAVVQRPTAGPAFIVDRGDLQLRGFTLNKGARCVNGKLSIAGVVFENPPAEVRPWLDGQGCMLDVVRSELRNSTGVGIFGGTVFNISDTRIEDSASHGIHTSTTAVKVTRCHVWRSKGIGVNAEGGGLTVEGSTFTGNRGGAIRSYLGGFSIMNNFVIENGFAGASGFGGMQLDSTVTVNRVIHNTVVDNRADVNYTPILAGGVFCNGAMEAGNNIIAGNARGNQSYPNAQTGGNCNFANSIVREYEFELGTAMDRLHLTGEGPAVNAGTLSSAKTDIDGQLRSDGMPDIGADEFVP